jgi:CO/xanthine dehydrogenase Mo-binding subunit
MAAVANAVANAIGIRFTSLPMSPPRVLAAIEAKRKAESKTAA